MTSVWLEVKKALLADAERARDRATTGGPVENRDGMKSKGHVHDRFHDELRAFERIGSHASHPPAPFYPDEGSPPRTGGDGGRPWKRGGDIRESAEVSD